MKKLNTIVKGGLLAAALAIGAGYNANAAFSGPQTFSASGGSLSASATFEIVGGNLEITLANTSLNDVVQPSEVLTSLFFDLGPGVTLTPISASLNDSTVFFGPDGGGNVGGEWSYLGGLVGAPWGATMGISSSGLGLFNEPNFGGLNLQDPEAVNGLQYGLTSMGDNMDTGNEAVTGQFALIRSSIRLVLGVNGSFDGIGNVSFQYGTSLSEPNLNLIPPVPEPTTMIAGALLLLPFAASTIRRSRKSKNK